MWFGFLSSLVMGAILVAAGSLMLISGHAGALRCNGSACGTGSGGLAAGFIYLYAIFLVGRSVLNYKTFGFLLTDKTLSTCTGYFFRKSSTFRFDKIQDIDTFRGPLHAFLGVTTVAIWTALHRPTNSHAASGGRTGASCWMTVVLNGSGTTSRTQLAPAMAVGLLVEHSPRFRSTRRAPTAR